MSTTEALIVHDRERMNLAGLMLGELIRSNLETPRGAARAQRLFGNVGVVAGKMKITIRFDGGGVTIARGLDPDLSALVRGSLSGLLNVALGRGLLRAFLAGELSFSGNPFFLLKILPLIRVASSERQ